MTRRPSRSKREKLVVSGPKLKNQFARNPQGLDVASTLEKCFINFLCGSNCSIFKYAIFQSFFTVALWSCDHQIKNDTEVLSLFGGRSVYGRSFSDRSDIGLNLAGLQCFWLVKRARSTSRATQQSFLRSFGFHMNHHIRQIQAKCTEAWDLLTPESWTWQDRGSDTLMDSY